MTNDAQTVSGLRISVERASGYEPPASIRAALEELADAIRTEAESGEGAPEVSGFAQQFPTFNPLGKTIPGKYNPGPLQTICLGGFDCNGYLPADEDGEGGTTSCSWVYWD